MKASHLRVLEAFKNLATDRLDLHALFESAGNEPEQRQGALDAVEELVVNGLLESRGGDFYSLTDKGKKAISVGLPETAI